MARERPIDLVIECRGCGIENIFGDYTPSQPIVCNQCRERLIAPDLMETHKEFFCEECDLVMLLDQNNEIEPGESTCRCGSNQIVETEHPTVVEKAGQAGAYDFVEEEEEANEDLDWYRSGPSEISDEDYNDLFDKDLSQ